VSQLDVTNTDYMGGFQYVAGKLSFFPHAEGYVTATSKKSAVGAPTSYSFNYVYQYKDHLGNNRLSYTNNILSPGSIVVLEENHYYPFGLKHTNYNTTKYEFVKVESGNDYYINIEQLPAGGVSNYKYKYNGKEYQDELGFNVYDYGARFYDPATGRWYSVDQMAEKYYDSSSYIYTLNNPVIYVDPDGNEVEMCCDGLKGFLLGTVDNIAGTNLRNKYSSGTQSYRNGVSAANGTSLAVGSILTVKGMTDIGAGTTGLTTSGAVTLATGGLSVEVTGPSAAASTGLIGIGMAETALGVNILSNTSKNMKDDAASNGSNTSSKTVKEQASELKKANGDKNSVTVKSSNGQTRYDLDGKSHGGVDTPHKQTYKNNVVNGEVKSVSRTTKKAEPMTQQDIRTVRKVIEKRN